MLLILVSACSQPICRPGMASAPADQYHNKVTHRHYLLLLTDRDSGHYQLPKHCLNSWSRLLSGGVVGFWLEGKEKFQTTKKMGERHTVPHFQYICSQGRNRCSQSYMRHAVSHIFSKVLTDLPVFSRK